MGWLLRVSLPTDRSGRPVELAVADLWDQGTSGVAELIGTDGTAELVAGFDDRGRAEAAADRARAGGAAMVAVEPVDEQRWSDGVPPARVDLGGGREVEIEVGPAFGHGAHPTTVLAREALTPLVAAGAAVLDVGTGTGILALAALAAGAELVVAVESDPSALAVAARNLDRHRHLGPGRFRLEADLAAVSGPFDLVVVNVLAPVQLTLAAAIDRVLAPDGRLVLSGFLRHRADDMARAHPRLVERDRPTIDDWAGLVLAATPP